MKSDSRGTLYIVSTPIGNLKDITLRAVEVLKSVELIISEDTRTARKLLNTYGIKSAPRSYYAPREAEKASRYLDMAERGKNIALISESGTPCISDPGAEIVRRAHLRKIPVRTIPGPSAITAALSISGMNADSFFFAGFIPSNKSRRKKFLLKNLKENQSFVFYDSKRRIVDSLKMIADIDPDTRVFAVREMTKIYEEYFSGTPSEVAEQLLSKDVLKGEFTVICSR
ncbi:MAG: 16S rRNA (cytidine(1402)-2'-O)-methyltransferase [Elusimicrobiota bacterium]